MQLAIWGSWTAGASGQQQPTSESTITPGTVIQCVERVGRVAGRMGED